MAENKTYEVGDEFGDGVVTRVGMNNGHTEYSVAVVDESLDRPVDFGPKVAPQARATGQTEVLALNQERQDEVDAEAAAADEELAEKAKSDEEDGSGEQVKAADSPKTIREKTVSPDPAKTPAGNGSAGKTTSTK